MKLHLPLQLRSAVLSSIAVFAATVGSAHADFVWKGGDTISEDNWNVTDNWELTDGTEYPTAGDGPGTPNSNAWATIVINNASGTAKLLEGWAFKINVSGLSDVTANVKKLQGGSSITVGAGSTLNLGLAVGGSGNDGGDVNVTLDGTLNIILNKDRWGGVTNVNFGTLDGSASHGILNISKYADANQTYNSLTVTAVLDATATSEETTLHEIALGTVGEGVYISNLTSNITAENFNATTGVLTAEAANIGKYSLVNDGGTLKLQYVTGRIPSLTWNGTANNHVWNTTDQNWTQDGSAHVYDSNYSLVFGEISGDVSSTVELRGGTFANKEIQVNDAYTFLVTKDTTITADEITGTGSITKAGTGKLTIPSLAALTGGLKVNEGTVAISDALPADANLTYAFVADGATLSIKGMADGSGSEVVLGNKFVGTLQVTSGKIRVDAASATNIGNAKFETNGNVTLNFATSDSSVTSAWIHDINSLSGVLTLQAMQNANALAHTIDANITCADSLIKTDSGTLSITKNVEVNNLYVSQGTLVFESGSNVTVKNQIRMCEDGPANGRSSIVVKEGATVTVQSSNNNHSTSDSVVLAHWGRGQTQTSALTIDGGTFDASGTTILMCWDGTGTMSVNGGTAKLLGLNFWAQGVDPFRGTFNLGSAEGGDGVLELGGTGFQNLGNGTTVNLGNGTIKAMANTGLNRNRGFNQGAVNLIGTNGGTKFDTNGHNFNIDNINVAGGGDLVKTGEGSLTFNGQVEAGMVTVQQGTLTFNGALETDAVTIEGGSMVLNGELQMSANSKLRFVAAECATSAPMLTLNGSITAGDGLTIEVELNSALPAGHAIELIRVSSLSSLGDYRVNVPVAVIGNRIIANALEWNDTTRNGTWNSTSPNWAGGTLFAEGMDVHFGDTAAGAVTIYRVVKPANVYVDNSEGNDYTFSGGYIHGNLYKCGTGTLVLNNENLLSEVEVHNGTLRVSKVLSLGKDATVTLHGGTLDLGGVAATNAITADGGTLAGASAYNGELTIRGDVAVDGALQASTISLTNGTLTFEEALTVTSGSLSLLGNAVIHGGVFGGQGLQNVAVSGSGNRIEHIMEGMAFHGGDNTVLNNRGNLQMMGNGDIEFSNVSSSSSGGAIYSTSTLDFTGNGDVSFENNTASYSGGAIYNSYGTLSFTGNGDISFENNTASYSGGAIYNSYGTLSFTGNGDISFENNTASYSGGAIYNSSGTLSFTSNGDISFENNSASGSYNDFGGAIYNNSGTLSFTGNGDVTFQGNFEKRNRQLRSLYSNSGTVTLSATTGKSIEPRREG